MYAIRSYYELAVAEHAEHVLARVRQGFEPRQPEEAAGPLDRVHQPENVGKDGGVVGIAFEIDQFDVA